MSSNKQIAGSKRARCGHALSPVLRKKTSPATNDRTFPIQEEKDSVPEPVVVYGQSEFMMPFDSRSCSTPCSDATWMSNPYFSSSSVSSTPYPSGQEFSQAQYDGISHQTGRNFGETFGLNDNLRGYPWSQPHEDTQTCGDSPPCTDPTCADALPCPDGEDSCVGFACPKDEICFDQDCLPNLLQTDICFDDKCQTRCPSPCFSQDCDIPTCDDTCPVSANHADCPEQITDCHGDCFFENSLDCYGPPCGCIDPQCLQRNHEGCNHELYPHPTHRQTAPDMNSLGHMSHSHNHNHAHTTHHHSHQHLEQLLGPLMCAHHEHREQIASGKPCDHAPCRTKSHPATTHARPHVHHKLHSHVHRLGSHAPHEEHKEIYHCLWCLPGDTNTTCGLAFNTAEELHQHLEQAHVDGLQREDLEHNGFFCRWQGCDRFGCRSFHARPKLKRHLQTHTLYKPFVCPKCGIQMKTKDAMEKHERTHTGERPYQCNVPGCSKIFATSTELKTHMVVHSGLKPHICPICGEGFADSSNLSKHKKTHFVGMYRCLTCGARMKRWDQMRRHIVTQGHSTELLDDKVAQRDYKLLMEKEFKELPEDERMIG